MKGTSRRDVVIVGGGHNALVAAAYLAQAGRSVTVLERLDSVGGAAVSAEAFAGIDARLSRYSYLVSLLPARIIRELQLDIELRRRRYSSYTPLPGTDRGLLVDNGDADATSRSFASIGAVADGMAWPTFYDGTSRLARSLFPSVCEPLMTRSEARLALGEDALWSAVIEEPLGHHIEASFQHDLVRGVALTDALIGTFAPAQDTTLAANRCFLYHVIGNGTGDWDVPVGGMGAVSGALEAAAGRAGADVVTGAEVTAVTPDGEVTYRSGDEEHTIAADVVLSGVAPAVLDELLRAGVQGWRPANDPLGVSHPRSAGEHEGPEGAQVKVNLLLSRLPRLPRLRDERVDPVAAFGGTFHINEGYQQLDDAYRAALAGAIPNPLPTEIYCHSLTDPSILSKALAASGAHTLTVFALHTPNRLITAETNDRMREQLERAVLDSLNSVLAEPVEPLLLTDSDGRPTIETKTTLDLERALGLPGGHIFHGLLEWPFVEDDAPLGSAADRWGVATQHPRILLCGSGAQRGGAVSGIGGHNAAMAVLEG